MERWEYLFHPLNFHPPADPEEIGSLNNRLGVRLPNDYLNYLRHSNGGFAGDVKLWMLEELEEFNRLSHDEERAPGLFLFGSLDGDGYGFDLRPGSEIAVVKVDMAPDWKYCSFEAPNFTEFWWSRSKDEACPPDEARQGWIRAEFLSSRFPARPQLAEALERLKAKTVFERFSSWLSWLLAKLGVGAGERS